METIRDLLLHMDCHKSMGPDGIHPSVLRELADVIAGAAFCQLSVVMVI